MAKGNSKKFPTSRKAGSDRHKPVFSLEKLVKTGKKGDVELSDDDLKDVAGGLVAVK